MGNRFGGYMGYPTGLAHITTSTQLVWFSVLDASQSTESTEEK